MSLDAPSGIFALVADAGAVVLVVLFTLLAFSVVSWAIIAYKAIGLRAARYESKLFMDAFFDVAPERLFAESERLSGAPLARVYRAGYIAFRALDGKNVTFKQAQAVVARAIKRATNAETKQLASLVPFLATVGNTAPFIGLFGTVWGIMTSFQAIGVTRSASLSAVAPGISEALVATAVGLAAAIPAVMGYNYLTQQVGLLERDIEEFAPEFVTALINEP
uniref:Cell division and transport-associated protein TolQ n=1 Tax=Chlorobium chlorochromatii (strain CaD3) TaxID=340177 RepID=Q3APB8_CHLCH